VLGSEDRVRREYVSLWRLFWVGPLTVLSSVAAVLLIRLVAVALLHPDDSFLPLTLTPPILDTVIGSGAAVFVFLKTGEYSVHPIRAFRNIAAGVLALSFVPDVVLVFQHWYGGTWPEAFALIAMHVAVWAICITLLPALGVLSISDSAARAGQ
jgi:hypothetical protein